MASSAHVCRCAVEIQGQVPGIVISREVEPRVRKKQLPVGSVIERRMPVGLSPAVRAFK